MANYFTNKNIGIAAGAGFGAYTQDPLENNLAGIAGAAIGAYTASSVSSDVADLYKNIRPNKLTMDSITRRRIDVSSARDNSILSARESINREVDSLASRFQRAADEPSDRIRQIKIDELKNTMNNVKTVFGSEVDGFSGDLQSVYDNISKYKDSIYDDRKKMMQFKDILSNRSTINTVSGGALASSINNHIPMRPGDSLDNIQNKLMKHFSENLGNDNATATRKSAAMAPALVGKTIDIEDGRMTFRNQGAKDVSFNLTSQADGVNFTENNGMRQIVRSVNPFGELYSKNKPMVFQGGEGSISKNIQATASDSALGVSTKYHPEELIGMMFDANKDITPEELSKLSNDVNALSLYSAPDSRSIMRESVSSFENSEYARRITNTVETGLSFRQEPGKRTVLSKMNTSIQGADERSPVSEMLNKLAIDTGKNPLVNQGTSALTLITPSEDAGKLYTPGLFAAENRGATSVSFRDHIPVHSSTSSYLKYNETKGSTPGAAELRRSASHGTRIQMSDALAEMVPDMYGNKLSIDDGHGIANEAMRDKFAVKQSTSVTIGNVGDNINAKYLLSMGIPEEVIAGSRSDAIAYLRQNDIHADSGQILGYDKERRAAKLANHFSGGKLKDIVKSKDGLELVFTGKYEPKDWTKIFGTASKSGLSFTGKDNFSRMGALALAESRGIMTLNKGRVSVGGESGIGNLKEGKQYGMDRFQKAFFKSDIGKSLMEEAGAATMIQRWDDIGQEGVSSLLHGNKKVGNKFIEELTTSARGKGFDSELGEMAKLGFSKQDRAEKASIYRTMLMMSDQKSSQDMFLTAAEYSARTKNYNDVNFLTSMEKKGVGITDAEKTRMRSILKNTYNSIEGTSYTQFTANVGESIHGAGKSGSMSWLEYGMLKSMGFDEGILNTMTESNRGALQELSMIESTFNKGNFGFKSFKAGEDVGRTMQDVFRMKSDDRESFLKRKGINTGKSATMANYTLGNKVEGLSSIPIGFEDTNYTGLKDYAGKEMLFEIERARQDVIASDVRLSNATTSAAKQEAKSLLESNAKALLDIQGRMMSGENNLRKEAAKRIAKDSMILTARPLSGTADTAEDILYVSEDLAEKMYKRQGLKLSEHVDLDDGIGTLKNKHGQNLFAQVSREPVQGPFSSMGFQIKVDQSLGGTGDHIFIPKSNELLNKFAFLDYDADHLRMLPIFSLSKKQTETYMSKNAQNLEHARTMLSVQDKLGIKGASKHLNLVSQFNDMTDKERHMLGQGELGRLRKIDSPDVTRMVSEFNKALDIEGAGVKWMAEERMLAHNLTENLLKSQHKASGSSLRGAVQEMAAAQADLLKTGEESKYKSRITGIIDATIGGKKSSMNQAEKNIYDDALRNLVNASAKHHSDINSSMETFLGPKGYKDMSSAQVQQAIIEYGGMQSGQGPIPSKTAEIDTESVKHSAKKMYNRASTEVASFMSNNKGKLAAAALGLAGVSIMARDTPDQLPSTSPMGDKAQPLQPLPDKKGYIRKYNPSNEISVSASVYSNRDNLNSRSLDRALFGDGIGNISVNITDKSGMF